jgi:hypothetical protein
MEVLEHEGETCPRVGTVVNDAGVFAKRTSRYKVELQDTPGELGKRVVKPAPESRATAAGGLWDPTNCRYPRPSNPLQARPEDYPENADGSDGDSDGAAAPLLGDGRGPGLSPSRGAEEDGALDEDDAGALEQKRSARYEPPPPLKQERRRNELFDFARICMGYIVVFDLGSQASFAKAADLIEEIRSNMDTERWAIPIVLFGNKHDRLENPAADMIAKALRLVDPRRSKLMRRNPQNTVFCFGSVQFNYVYFPSQSRDFTRRGCTRRFRLHQIVHLLADTDFLERRSNDDHGGLVSQVYLFYQQKKGDGAEDGDEEEALVLAEAGPRRPRRGLLANCLRWTVCCPCTFAALCCCAKRGGEAAHDD